MMKSLSDVGSGETSINDKYDWWLLMTEYISNVFSINIDFSLRN